MPINASSVYITQKALFNFVSKIALFYFVIQVTIPQHSSLVSIFLFKKHIVVHLSSYKKRRKYVMRNFYMFCAFPLNILNYTYLWTEHVNMWEIQINLDMRVDVFLNQHSWP